MNEPHHQVPYDPGRLLIYLMQKLQLKNDIALSRALRISLALLNAIREQRFPVAGAVLIQMQEISQLSITELRKLMGDRRRTCRMPTLLA